MFNCTSGLRVTEKLRVKADTAINEILRPVKDALAISMEWELLDKIALLANLKLCQFLRFSFFHS